MNQYEELIYSLIANCNREITKEEKKILNQASAIYNTYNNLTDELGCPLEVLVRALKDGVYVLDRETGGTKCILRGFVNSVQHFDGDVFGFVDDRFWAKIKDEETGLYIPILYAWKDYKKTWWLKEDKSE